MSMELDKLIKGISTFTGRFNRDISWSYDTGFDEVEYSIDPAGTFGVIQFKIVLVSNSSSNIPKVKDFRAICST